jgi:murein DD-endopeptidase MepM/ murein hydrolase activator NlpD
MRKLLLGAAAGLLVGGAAPAPVQATSPSDLQQQQQVLSQIRAQLNSNLADALAAQEQLRQSLADNTAQQQDLQRKINDAQAKIDDLDRQIADAQAREAVLQQRIDTERAQLRSLARALYMQPASILVTLAEAQSLGDLLTRAADLSSAGAQASELKDKLSGDLTELQAERKKEQDARAEQVKQRDRLASALSQLQDLEAQQEQSMQQLEVKIWQTQRELALVNTQSTQLAQEITDMLQAQQDAIIAAAMQAVWNQVQVWSQSNSVGQIPTSAGHSTKYRFIWPEPFAQISQPFGPTTYWFEPPYAGYPHFHTGIDLVEPFGSPILAADDGIVVLVGADTNGYGNYVVLAHSGGLDTLYGHLSAALVKPGQSVTQGEPIGLEGSTGNSTGPHLHFEVRYAGVAFDPMTYLDGSPADPYPLPEGWPGSPPDDTLGRR